MRDDNRRELSRRARRVKERAPKALQFLNISDHVRPGLLGRLVRCGGV
jgi:hypothetical protein